MYHLKARFLAVFVLITSIAFMGCGKEELFDVKIPFEIPFEGSLNLPLPTSGLSAPFSITDSISIQSIEELKDYTDRLKALNFKGIEFHISNFSGNPSAELEGSLTMSGDFGSASAPFGPSSLEAVSDSELPIVLEFDAAEQGDISDALLAFKKLEMSLAGEASNPPANFDYKLIFKFEAVANALDQL